jgi:hypothetical protein
MKIAFYYIMRLALLLGWMVSISHASSNSVMGRVQRAIAAVSPMETTISGAIGACSSYLGGVGQHLFARMSEVSTLVGNTIGIDINSRMRSAINAIKPNASSMKVATDMVISTIKPDAPTVEGGVSDVAALIGGQGALSVQIGVPTDVIPDVTNDTFPDLTNNVFQPTDSVFAKLYYVYWRLKQQPWAQQPANVHDAIQMILKEIGAPNTNPALTGVIDIDDMMGGNSYVPINTRFSTLHQMMGGVLPSSPSTPFDPVLTKASAMQQKTAAIYKKITGVDTVVGSMSILDMLDVIDQRLGE